MVENNISEDRNFESHQSEIISMASLHKSSTLNLISTVVLVLYSAGSPATTCAATSVPPNLMTGLNLGKLSSVRIQFYTNCHYIP